jgi:hypothetical protein
LFYSQRDSGVLEPGEHGEEGVDVVVTVDHDVINLGDLVHRDPRVGIVVDGQVACSDQRPAEKVLVLDCAWGHELVLLDRE